MLAVLGVAKRALVEEDVELGDVRLRTLLVTSRRIKSPPRGGPAPNTACSKSPRAQLGNKKALFPGPFRSG